MTTAKKITAPTLAALRKAAAAKGFTVEHDADCQCYRLGCQPGQRFADDLHELISVYGPGFIGNGLSMAGARLHMLADIIGRVPEPCDNPTCEWCGRA